MSNAAITALVFDASAAAAGAAQFDAAGQRIVGTNQAVVVATSRSQAAIDGLDRALAQARRAVDPVGAALDRLSRQTTTFDRALQRGKVAVEEHSRLVALATGRYDASVAAAQRATGAATAMTSAMAGVANAARLTTREMQLLSPQLADIGVSLAGGMNPLLVLIQQGPQITDALGGVARAFALLRSAITPTVAAIAAATTAVAGSIAVADAQARALAGVSNRLRATRNDYDQLTASVERAARAAAGSTSLGTSQAREAGQIIAGQRNFSGSQADLDGLVALSGRLATVMGSEVPEAAERLAAAFAGPAAAARKMVEDGLRPMDEGLLRTIQRFENQGNVAEATRLVLGAYGAAAAEVAKSPLQAALDGMSQAFTRLWQVLRPVVDAVGTVLVTGLVAVVNGITAVVSGLAELGRMLSDSRISRFLFGEGVTAPAVAAQRSATDIALERARQINPRSMQREDLEDRMAGLRSGLSGATADQARVIGDALRELQGQYEGMRGPVADYLRGLREQADLAGVAEGAARELAQAEAALNAAARQDGQGQASAAALAEARVLVMRRLNGEFLDHRERLNASIGATNRQTEATAAGTRAADDARITTQAETEARRFAAAGTDDYNTKVASLVYWLKLERDARDALRNAQAITQQNQQLELIRAEVALLGESAAVRERELAALRERQRIIAEMGDPETESSRRRIANAREISDATRELTRQRDAFAELERIGEQAFERIGSAITQAFANGSLKAIDFGNLSKAVFAEIVQAALRLAVINPIINSAFGGNRTTAWDVASAASKGGGASGQATSPGILGRLGGMFDGGASVYSPGYSFSSGVVGRVDRFAGTGIGAFLDRPVWSTSATPGNVGAFAEGAMTGTGTTATNGLSYGQLGMGALSIAGGAYGIYSGLQQGGPRGYTNAFAGAAGVVGGGAGILSAMGVGGAAMAGVATVAPYVAIAAAIVATLLPEQKPSNREQNVTFNTQAGLIGTDGQTGKKFSQENADAARAMGDQIQSLAGVIGAAAGLSGAPNTTYTVGYGDRDGIYFKDAAGNSSTFSREDEGAAQKLIEAATNAFLAVAAEQSGDAGVRQVISNNGRVGSEATLANLQWYQGTYKALSGLTPALSAFEQELNGLKANFDNALTKAKELGLGEEGLTAQRQIAVDKLFEQRLEQLNSIKATIEENTLRAEGRTAQAEMAQAQRESAAATKALGESLKAMGLTADEAAPYVDALTQQLAAQQAAVAAALRRQQREAIDAVDLRSRRAIAGQTGNAADAMVADLFEFDSRALSELSDLEDRLKALGFVASDISPRLDQLVRAHKAERDTIIATYQALRTAAAQALDDRLFAATTDTSTQAGAMAALERDQARERVDVARAGLVELTALEEVHAAERAGALKRFAEQERQAILSAGGSIRAYVDSLRSGAAGGASPEDRLTSAQGVFARDLQLSRGGDRDALARITQSADSLLQSGQAMYASGSEFQALRGMVLSSLEALPAVKSYDQLIYEALEALGGSIQVEVEMAAELKLRADIAAALALIDTSAATPRAKAEAEAALSQLVGVMDAILVPAASTSAARVAAMGALSTITGAIAAIAVAPGITDATRSAATARLQDITGAVSAITLAAAVPEAVKVAASRALSSIAGAVASIAVSTTVTDATRALANAALDDIIGRVSAISMAPAVPAAVRERANAALATIAGNVASISLATGVTDAVKAQAITRLSSISGAVSTISMSPGIPEAVRLSASDALASISGAVSSIAVSTTVTGQARQAANAALDDIVGKVSAISMAAAIPAAVRGAANAALASISGNVASIALATGVTDAVKAAAIARLTGIVGVLDQITIKAGVPEAARAAASAALASISGVVSLIAVNASITDAARGRANAALDDIVAVVERIIVSPSVTAAARVAASEALVAISGNVGSITLAAGVTDAVKAAATARLNAIVGRVEAIIMAPAVPEAVRVSASKALSAISAAVSSIAVGAAVTDAARQAANAALDDIVGKVSAISMAAAIPAAVRGAANAALASIAGNVSSITLATGVTDAVKAAAAARLSAIVGRVEAIAMAPAVPEAVRVSASKVLSAIGGAVSSIAVSASVTDAARAQANAALDDITGRVAAISMSAAIPEGVRDRANVALGTIAGNVASIALASGVTDVVRAAATSRLATITGAVSAISMAAAIPEGVRKAASDALAKISGQVTSIAVSAAVTDAARARANAALDDIVAKVSAISMATALPAATRASILTALGDISAAVTAINITAAIQGETAALLTANLSKIVATIDRIAVAPGVQGATATAIAANLSSIAASVERIALAPGVTDAVRNEAAARLATITGVVSKILMADALPEGVRKTASNALASISGVVSSIAVSAAVTSEARLAASDALGKIVGAVSLISMAPSVPATVRERANAALSDIAGNVGSIALATGVTNAARLAANTALGNIIGSVSLLSMAPAVPAAVRERANTALSNIAGSVTTVALATGATDAAKTAMLRDFGSITAVLGVATDLSGIPAEQLDILFSSADIITRTMALEATGGTLTVDQRAILRAEAGRFDREVKSILSGATALTADQRAILLAGAGTVNRILKQQVETTETIEISRSIDNKISAALATLNYTVKEHLPFLTRLPDVQAYLFHILQAARGASGGVRVTTLQSSGSLNGGFAYNGPQLPDQPGWGNNYGGLEAGGWVGNGIWNRDSVIARYAGGGDIALAGGEFVTRAPMAARYAPELQAMNSGTYRRGNDDVVAELREVRRELAQLRRLNDLVQITADAGNQNAAGHKQTAKMLDQMRTGQQLARARPA